jgi:hypothetical protein
MDEAARARAFLLRLVGALTSFGAPATMVEQLGAAAGRGMLLRMDSKAHPGTHARRLSPLPLLAVPSESSALPLRPSDATFTARCSRLLLNAQAEPTPE